MKDAPDLATSNTTLGSRAQVIDHETYFHIFKWSISTAQEAVPLFTGRLVANRTILDNSDTLNGQSTGRSTKHAHLGYSCASLGSENGAVKAVVRNVTLRNR